MYQVEWVDEALEELARFWTQANPEVRRAITSAVEALDRELQSDPYGESESRGGEMRVQFAYPLAIDFMVDSQQRIVWVSHVRRFRRRGERDVPREPE